MVSSITQDRPHHDWSGAIRLLRHFQKGASDNPPRLEQHDGYGVDVYQPASEPQTTVIFIPGLSIHGHEDPRIRRLGHALQSAGVRVLIPDVPSLRSLRITSDQPREIKELLISLAQDSNLVTTSALSLLSVSFSSVFVLAAASDPALHRRLGAIGLIGGYFDIETVSRFLLESPIADPYGKLIIARSYLKETASSDAIALGILDRAIRQSAIENTRAVPLDELFDLQISQEERVFRWLTEPCSCRGLHEKIMELFNSSWSGYAASGPFSKTMCPVFLLHGRQDRVIPVEQSTRLGDTLAKHSVPHLLCVSDLVAHGNTTISMRRSFEIARLIRGFAWFLGRAKGSVSGHIKPSLR